MVFFRGSRILSHTDTALQVFPYRNSTESYARLIDLLFRELLITVALSPD